MANRGEVTTDWREPPLGQPESSLLGELYECNPLRAFAAAPAGRAYPSRSNLGRFDTRSSGL